MSLLLAIFIVLSALSILGALGVVFAQDVVHSALSLLLALLMAAGLFVLLLSQFLALVQVLIYAGAITVLLLFAIMLTRTQGDQAKLDSAQKPLALVVGGAVMAALVAAVVGTQWRHGVGTPQESHFTDVGRLLFSQWTVPFEIASIVLLVALVGAIVLTRSDEDE